MVKAADEIRTTSYGTRPRKKHRLLDLIHWELETTYRVPLFELVLGLTVLLVMTSPPLYVRGTSAESATAAMTLLATTLDSWLFLYFVAYAVPVAISLGGMFETGEVRILLSYPFRRFELVGTKVVANLLVLSGIAIAPVLVRVVLEFSPVMLAYPQVLLALGLLLLVLGLRVFLIVSVTAFFAVLSRNSKIAIFAAFGLLFLIMIVTSLLPRPFSFFVSIGQAGLVLLSFNSWLWGETPPNPFEFPGPLLFLAITSVVLLLAASLLLQTRDVT
jgi:ABC-type transport system involved in multi-copper enzyme maturation permease subunit